MRITCADCYYWGEKIEESKTGLPLKMTTGCTLNFKPVATYGNNRCQLYSERTHVARLLGLTLENVRKLDESE